MCSPTGSQLVKKRKEYHALHTYLLSLIWVLCFTAMVDKDGLDFSTILQTNEHLDCTINAGLDRLRHGGCHEGKLLTQRLTNLIRDSRYFVERAGWVRQ